MAPRLQASDPARASLLEKSLPPELTIDRNEPDWDYSYDFRDAGRFVQGHRDGRGIACGFNLYNDDMRQPLRSRATLLFCRSQREDFDDTASSFAVYNPQSESPPSPPKEISRSRFVDRSSKERSLKEDSKARRPSPTKIRARKSHERKATAAHSLSRHNSLLDDYEAAKKANPAFALIFQDGKPKKSLDSTSEASPSCLGLALYPVMRSPTPPKTRTRFEKPATPPRSKIKYAYNPDSPKSVMDEDNSIAADESERHDLLELQRELKALKRWAIPSRSFDGVEEPNPPKPNSELLGLKYELKKLRGWTTARTSNSKTRRVRFAHPIVTAVKHRPYTAPEDLPKLYFGEEELRILEEDRANRIVEEQVELVVAPNVADRLLVSVCFPRRLSRAELQRQREYQSRGKLTPTSNAVDI